ncbi:MAG: hypothetical protein ACRC6V_18570 [Bacteroidales bacterium]
MEPSPRGRTIGGSRMNRVYCAGHMLNRGSQMQRAAEKVELAAVNPTLEFYVPQENKEINNKTTAKQEGLAERIVKHDTDAIMWSDTVVIEPLAEACGTMVELGQLKGMKDAAEQVLRIMGDGELNESEVLYHIQRAMQQHIDRKVYPHFEDFRRVPGITESEDRRSLGINQYVYGVCLDLTDGVGIYEWPDILNEARG